MYSYDDEDNVPMIEDNFDQPVYPEAYKKDIPDGCWNCFNFDWKREACTVNWNNMDESYYNPDIDDRELTDCCDYHQKDPDIDPEEIFWED